MFNPSISGKVGRISQVPQGGIPGAGTQPQCYIWDPVWPSAKTHTQEHFMGLGEIWGATLCQLYEYCSALMYTVFSTGIWTVTPIVLFCLTCLNCRTTNAGDAITKKVMLLKCCVFFIMVSSSGLGSQMGWFVRAQLRSCSAKWLQIWLFSPQEHHDTVPVRFPLFITVKHSVQLSYRLFQ